MGNAVEKISLGFTREVFDAGVHICQIYSDESERKSILVDFLTSGIQDKECTCCFSEKDDAQGLGASFHDQGIDYNTCTENGSFSLSAVNDIYFSNNEFNPDRMLELLTSFYNDAMEKQYSGARVIGEMTPRVKEVAGGNRLMEYESRVSMLQRKIPVTAVCQYDAREFDGATIMDILKVHPYMIVKGSVVHNPFYIKPEEILKL